MRAGSFVVFSVDAGKQRVAQLQSDIMDLSAETDRLRQERERLHGRRAQQAPNPLGGGQ